MIFKQLIPEELLVQYNNIQRMYFHKCRELSEIENALKEYEAEITKYRTFKRIKLKNSKKVLLNKSTKSTTKKKAKKKI